MIRRDYILRMIEEFVQGLARLKGLKQEQRWEEAEGTLEQQFQQLVGVGPDAVAQLSETELLAKVIQGEPTLAVRDKTLMLATLLKEAGDLAAAHERLEESCAFYLKGLHLLLETLGRTEVFECPEFVPRVAMFVTALEDASLPFQIQGLLMQHYERTLEFAKAENALFAMLDLEPNNAGLVDFGISFYERLQGQSDAALAEGNLPRTELEASLKELRDRKTQLSARSAE
jgi:hypothetical protein